MFALGVVSVNFANFERSLVWMLAAVTGSTEEYARLIHAKYNVNSTLTLIDLSLKNPPWKNAEGDHAEAVALIRHFTTAADGLAKNRNLLLHSVVLDGPANHSTL
ncbi:MAG: hypothetical protein K8F25_07995, partial [Fimbriimonadaceae bacterium]|nr:hypothetical protein [Alphaproteobacteria bacterium]